MACLMTTSMHSSVLMAEAATENTAQYAIPTRIDHIGRIVVPVKLNDRGPFRLMLDTGATHSTITRQTAQQLDLIVGAINTTSVQGVMGRIDAPTAKISELRAGSLTLNDLTMPIMDGAVVTELDGILGVEGLANKIVTADFINDRIRIADSASQRPAKGYAVMKFQLISNRLIVVDATVDRYPVRAVIDTGGSDTIGNLALFRALTNGKHLRTSSAATRMVDVTNTTRDGHLLLVPKINIDVATITNAAIVTGDFEIFRVWKLDDRPALLIGMDVLGQLSELSIDYKRRELWVLER